jgi:hypothetical protein
MAYVKGFTNDVFISYAHADNTEGWVNQFHDRLGNRLRQLDGNASFEIWRDPKVDGADVVSDKIYKNLNSSGILISILSPNGLDSNWCQQERERFERATRSTGGFRLGDKVRAIKVTKTPCTGDQHRDVFGTLGYEFYRRVQQTGRFVELGLDSQEFNDKVLEIAQEVHELLQQLNTRVVNPLPDLAVYVAAVSSDLDPCRTCIVNQLEAWNCRVYPEGVLVGGLSLSRTSISKALSACSFSVHCVGPRRPSVPEDETLSLDLLQLECARASQINRVVCQIGQPHVALEQSLKQTANQGVEDLIRPETQDRLLQLLEDRVGSLRKAGAGAAGNLPTVYVVCSPAERDDALQIKHCLEAERHFAAVLPIHKVDDESVRLRDHRSILMTCHAVVIYWGAKAKEAWFREQQRDVIGARQKRRANPLPGFCLSLSPDADPDTCSRPDFPFQQISDLECSKVRPFFSYLDTAAKRDRR